MKKVIFIAFLIFTGMMSFAQSKGRVLNIYSWNDEFMERVRNYYPGYNKDDDTIGKVKVNWVIMPSVDGAYQNKLDEDLIKGSDMAADQRIDLFLVEPDYALKYTGSEYTMNIKDLGITESDLKNQFEYTKNLWKTSNGEIKALTWQVWPGVFIYRRSIAKKVLGSAKPDYVQKLLSTWDGFDAVAKKMDKYNYYMLSGYDDDFRVFYDNMETPWVLDGKINVDESLKRWVKQTKLYTEEKRNNHTSLWFSEWIEGMMKGGRVFGYFGPAWLHDYVMPHEDYFGDDSSFGDWAVCKGPQGFFWGGSWICAAAGTDNADLIKDILLKMTCDESIMTAIEKERGDIVNNEKVLSKLSKSDLRNDFLGGQNPVNYYLESAKSITKANVTPYDMVLNEKFQAAMYEYFIDAVTEEQAYNNFYEKVLDIFPNLSK